MGMVLIGDPFVVPKKDYIGVYVNSPSGGEYW